MLAIQYGQSKVVYAVLNVNGYESMSMNDYPIIVAHQDHQEERRIIRIQELLLIWKRPGIICSDSKLH